MSEAFDIASRILKGQYLYYNVHVSPDTPEEYNILYELEDQLASEGISYDSGGSRGGRDMHFDFSLKGADKDAGLSRLAATGIPYQVEMIASDIPPHGSQERIDHDNAQRKALDAMLEQQTGQAHMDGKPYAPSEVIGHAPCPNPECMEAGTMGAVIEENPALPNSNISFACGECGHMDMDYEGSWQ